MNTEQIAKEILDKITKLGGKVKNHKGVNGIWFDGPTEAQQNPLFIPLPDFGYSEEHGIFRKSIQPNYESEINL